MVKGIYPGSFDPVTFGHLDVISRAAKMYGELTVGVLDNQAKNPLFSVAERVKMLKECTKDITNVKVEAFSGLSIDFAKKTGAAVIVRGLRAFTDFDYELQMAQTNHILDKQIDTVFLATSLEYAYLSSTTVKEVAAFGGDISLYVPHLVAENMKEKLGITKKIHKE